jgi:hypothetical protein
MADSSATPTSSCRRRPVSTASFVATKEAVDTGLRRHDGDAASTRQSLAGWPGEAGCPAAGHTLSPAGHLARRNLAEGNIDGGGVIGDNAAPRMAGVAQVVERQVVVLDAVGSSPIARPIPAPSVPSVCRPPR